MRIAIFAIGLAGACTSSSGTTGDPQNGNATVVIGGTPAKLAVGSAIADPSVPGNMIVQLGTADVTCSTDLDSSGGLSEGQFVYFSVSASAGVYSDVQIDLTSEHGGSVAFESGPGSVDIDAVATRVTGELMYSNGNAANGTFDVEKCF